MRCYYLTRQIKGAENEQDVPSYCSARVNCFFRKSEPESVHGEPRLPCTDLPAAPLFVVIDGKRNPRSSSSGDVFHSGTVYRCCVLCLLRSTCFLRAPTSLFPSPREAATNRSSLEVGRTRTPMDVPGDHAMRICSLFELVNCRLLRSK